MVFAHDTEVALEAAAALVNTRGDCDAQDADTLSDVAALDAFLRAWAFTGDRASGAGRTAELDAVLALRGELARLWEAGEPAVVAEAVNRLLADGGALPQLVRHDGWDWHLHATPPDAPLGTRMAVEAAMALLDVVRSCELDRLKVCEADGCSDAYVDLSRNRSRRYCGTRCGNRADAAAYRARRASAQTVAPARITSASSTSATASSAPGTRLT